MPPFIEEDAILLPDFLFYFDDLKSKSISPAASFNPTAAVAESGFQSSSSPSNKPNKRIIVLDKSSVSNLEYGEQIALVKRLQLAGFSIFLCCSSEGRNVFCKVNDDLNNVKQLHSLSNFIESDYHDLAKVGVAREQSLIMNLSDRGQMGAVKRAFSHTHYTGKISGNDWKCEMRIFSDDEIEGLAKRIILTKVRFRDSSMSRSPTWKEQLAFYLDRTTLGQQHDIISDCERPDDAEMFLFLANPNLNEFAEEDDDDLIRSFEKSVEVTSHSIARIAKIFPDQEDKVIESYFAKACAVIKTTSVVYDMIFLIQTFPNQKEKLIKILKDSHEHFKKFDNLGESEVQLQKFIIDIFEGRRDEAIASCSNNEDASMITLALITEGVVSEKLLKGMDSFYFSSILDWARGSKYEVIEMLTNYAFNNPFEEYVRLEAVALMSSVDSEKAEELLKKHKPNFEDEVILKGFIKTLAPEARNRVYDLYPQYADYQLSGQDLLEMNHPANPSARPKMTYLTIPKLSGSVLIELISKTKPQEIIDAVVIDLIDDNVDDAILFLKIMGVGCNMRDVTKKQKYLSNSIDSLKVLFNFKKKNLFTEIDEDNEDLKKLWDRIEDAEASLKSTIDDTKELFPKINFNVRHLTLPKSLEKNIEVQEILKTFGDEISYDFVDRQNYLGIGDAIKKFERQSEVWRGENELRSGYLLPASVSPSLPPKKIKFESLKVLSRKIWLPVQMCIQLTRWFQRARCLMIILSSLKFVLVLLKGILQPA